MKRILIIGAAGFVGSYLIDHLYDTLECHIVATKLPNEEFWHKNINIEDLDITNPIAIIQLLKETRPDWIINLAAQNSIGYTWENPGLTVEVNIKGSINILDAVKQLEYKPKILLIGSGEEYGVISESDAPFSESMSLHPSNIYGATKACQNMMAAIYAKAYDMQIIMARSFNYVGPGQSTLFVISDFAKQIAEIEKHLREPIINVGNLKSKRDFIDVRDIVRAYTLLLELGKSGEVYNIGSGKAVLIETVLNKLLLLSKKRIAVNVSPQKIRPIDVPIVQADITKIVNTTGWKPQMTLEQSLKDVLTYWRNNV